VKKDKILQMDSEYFCSWAKATLTSLG
jgi:hypothetical protein